MSTNVGTLTIEMAANVARLSRDMDAAKRTVEKSFGDIENMVGRLKDTLGGVFAGLSVTAFVAKVVDVQRQFDVLNSSLVTVTGSSEAADRAFAWIKEFAATTPFQLGEVTQAFVKMKAMGLDASRESLTSYGNTASAMGKSLNQMIEAVADAATGEFERLKEFGIKAKQQGDQVTLTFQGVSTTIGNNAQEITQYLQQIGNVDFAGAMERRAATLDGAISNLADTWDELFRTISQQQAGTLIYDGVQLASAAINDLITIIKALTSETQRSTQSSETFKVVQEAVALVFETVIAVGVNVKYVITQVINEIIGLYKQSKAILSGNFEEAGAIRRQMVADAQAARLEVDQTTERIINARKNRTTAAQVEYRATEYAAKSAGKTVTAETDKQVDAYRKLIQSITDKTGVLELEAQQSTKLSDAQKTTLGVMQDIQNGTLKLTDAQKLQVVQALEQLIASEKVTTQIGEQSKELRKAEEAQRKQEEETRKQIEAYDRVVKSIGDRIGALSLETNQSHKLTDAQKTALAVMQDIQSGTLKLTEAQSLHIVEMLELLIATEKTTAAQTKQDEENKKHLDTYKKLIDSIDERTGALQFETQISEQLTDAQKLALKVMQDLQSGTLELTDAQKEQISASLDQLLATEKSTTEAKKQADAFKKLTESIAEKTTVLQANLEATDNLTDGQKFAHKIMVDLRNGTLKLTDAQKEQIAASLEQLIATEKVNDELKRNEEYLKAVAKETISFLEAQDKKLQAILEEVDKQRDSNTEIELGKAAVDRLRIAKLQETAASLDRKAALLEELGLGGEVSDSYRQQAQGLRELAELKEEGIHVQAAKDAADEWKKTSEAIENSLTDALMRGFESGKDFGKNLVDTLINMFKTLVLRPIIQPIAQNMANVVLGAFGLGGAGSASASTTSLGAVNLMPSLQGTYNAITGSFAALGTSVAFAAQDIGAWLVTNTTGMLNSLGSTIMTNAGQIGNFAAGAGGALAGFGIGKAVSGKYETFGNSNIAPAAGAIIGTILGGPLGGIIGGTLGGVVNRAFGHGPKETMGEGITGMLTEIGADVQSFRDWVKEGGWFRSDKTGRDFNAISVELDAFLDGAVQMVSAATRDYAAIVGLNADALDGFSQQIEISLKDLTEAEQEEAIAKAIQEFQDALVARLSGALEPFRLAGESLAETLARLAQIQIVSEQLNEFGGAFTNFATASVGARQSIIDLAGGIEQLVAKTQGFVANFYTREEQAAITARGVVSALAQAGFTEAQIAALETKADFRTLLESIDVGTDTGQKQFVTLLDMSQKYSDMIPIMESQEKSLIELIDAAPQVAILQRIFESDASYQTRVSSAQQTAQATFESMLASLNAIDGSVDGLSSTMTTSIGALTSSMDNGLVRIASAVNDAIAAANRATASATAIAQAAVSAAQTAANAAKTASDAATKVADAAADQESEDSTTNGNTSGTIETGAMGGMVRGMTLVGEHGPELVNFGAPGQVYTAPATASILRDIVAAAMKEHMVVPPPIEIDRKAMGGTAEGMTIVGEHGPELVNFGAPGRVYTAPATAAIVGQTTSTDDGRAQRVLAERAALEKQVLEVTNDYVALKKLERDAIDESNRDLYDLVQGLKEKQQVEQEASDLVGRYLQLIGDTESLRLRELETVDQSNRLLLQNIHFLEDEQDRLAKAQAIADEKAGLEQQILQLQGDTTALRELELQGVDASNKSLLQRIHALQDEAEATAKAQAIADEKAGLEQQILQLQGDTAALRELELQGVDASNKSLLQRIHALQDEAEAAAKAQAIADQRAGLEQQILQLQGDTTALRELELQGVDQSNRSLLQRIHALQDEAEATAKLEAINNQRIGLETQLLQLQGKTQLLREQELLAVDESNRALQQRIWKIQDEQAAFAAAQQTTDRAFDALSNAIGAAARDAEKSITKAYDALRTSLEQQIADAEVARDVAAENVETIKGVVSLLDDSIKDLRDEVSAGMSAVEGSAFIAQAIATARTTGYLPERESLAEAIDAARSGVQKENFTTAFEFKRAQLTLAGSLEDLQQIAGTQLSAGERQQQTAEDQLEALQDRLKQAGLQHEKDIAANQAYYDQMLSSAQTQINHLRGINDGVMSVAAAMQVLALAIDNEQSTSAALAASGVQQPVTPGPKAADAALMDAAKALYYSTHGGYSTAAFNAAVEPLGGAAAAFEALGWDGSREGAAAIRAAYGFAAGGLHEGGFRIVGERGPEAEVTGPARYFSASDTAEMFGNGEMAAEIRALRDEVSLMRAETRATAVNTSKMVRLQDNWDVRGLTIKTDADQPIATVAA